MSGTERRRRVGVLMDAALSAYEAGHHDRGDRAADEVSALLTWPERKLLKGAIRVIIWLARFRAWRDRRRTP